MMTTTRSETQAWLDLMEHAKRAEWNGDREAAIRAEVGRLEDEGLPPVPALRRPALQVARAAGAELSAEEIRPGMRQIDGRWFYSAAWL